MRLDHVVHIVQQRERAADALRQMGLQVVIGGVHPNWGTHNALAYFEDLTYIELIGVQEPAVATGSDFGAPIAGFLEQGEGVGTAALRTTNIEADVARLRARSIAIGDPKDGSRRLPDSTLLTWRLALAPWPLPFLIEWGAPEAERRADLARRGALNAPGRRVAEVLWAVADLESGLGWLRDAYGATMGEAREETRLGGRCIRSDTGITLCAPIGPGPVAERLAQRGEGPLGYRLAGIDLPGDGPMLGAWIESVS